MKIILIWVSDGIWSRHFTIGAFNVCDLGRVARCHIWLDVKAAKVVSYFGFVRDARFRDDWGQSISADPHMPHSVISAMLLYEHPRTQVAQSSLLHQPVFETGISCRNKSRLGRRIRTPQLSWIRSLSTEGPVYLKLDYFHAASLKIQCVPSLFFASRIGSRDDK